MRWNWFYFTQSYTSKSTGLENSLETGKFRSDPGEEHEGNHATRRETSSNFVKPGVPESRRLPGRNGELEMLRDATQ